MHRVIKQVTLTLNRIGMGVILVMMFLTTIDAAGRYLVGRPLKGTLEVNEFMMAAVVFLGLAYTGLIRGHIAVDVVTIKLPTRIRTILDTINSILATGVFALIGWQGLEEALYALDVGARSDSLHIPVFPFKFLVPLGAFCLCVVLLEQFTSSMSQIMKSRGR